MSYRPRLAEEWTEQWEQVVELIKDLGPEKSLDKLNGESAETSQKFLSVEDNTKEFDGIRVVSAFSREVRTVQDLIEYHEIDTEIWEPDRVVANQWNQGSKGPDNKIVRVQLHQIKATFVKRLNVINAEIRKYIEQRQKETPIVVTSKDHEFQRYIVIGCVHRPFHDKKIWNALMNYIRDNRKRINGIVINGDYLDMKSLSSHDEKKRMPEGFDLGFEYEDGYAGLIDIKNAFGSNYKDVFKAFNFGNHCFTSDTEILTSDGWKDMDSYLESSDVKVATYCKDSGRIIYEDPERLIVKPYSGNIHHWTGQKLDVKVTPNHKMFYLTQDGNPKFGKSEDVKSKSMRMVCSAINYNPDYDISDEEIKLAAWLYTDSHKNNSGQWILYQSKEPYVSNIRELLNSSNIEYRESSRLRDITEICGKTLKKAPLESYEFHLSTSNDFPINNKSDIEPWIEKLSKRQFDLFLDTLIDADGSRHKSAPDTSHMLYGQKWFLEEIQTLCFKNGHGTSLFEYRDSHFRLNIHRDKLSVSVNSSKVNKNVSESHYDGFVWCLTMSKGTLVVRRNGKISVQGNCDRWFRHIGTNENSRYGRALQSPMDALDLEGLGYDVQLDWRSGYVQLGPKLQVFHGKYLGDTACKKHLDNSEGQSMIFNHTHAISAFYMGSRVAYNIGWMGDENSPGFAYADRFMINKWQKGFAIVDIDSNGEHYVNQIKCHSNGGFIADGKAY